MNIFHYYPINAVRMSSRCSMPALQRELLAVFIISCWSHRSYGTPSMSLLKVVMHMYRNVAVYDVRRKRCSVIMSSRMNEMTQLQSFANESKKLDSGFFQRQWQSVPLYATELLLLHPPQQPHCQPGPTQSSRRSLACGLQCRSSRGSERGKAM